MGVPAHDTFGQRAPVLLRGFSSCIPTIGGSQTGHKLLPNPNGNSGVERVNHTIAQMLAMVVNEQPNDWYLRLPQFEFAYNNPVTTATGLAPN